MYVPKKTDDFASFALQAKLCATPCVHTAMKRAKSYANKCACRLKIQNKYTINRVS